MKSKNNRTRNFLLTTFSITFVLIFMYAYMWQSEINKAYDWPYSVAKGAQQGLDAGISPDGVIEEITGKSNYLADLREIDMPKSESDDFIYIKETAKAYETGSDNIEASDLNISGDFIQKTQEVGEAQTTLRIPNGKRYAVQSFSFSYGDVRGVVFVGRLNKPNQEKIDMTRNIAIIIWAIVTTVAYVFIKPLKSHN